MIINQINHVEIVSTPTQKDVNFYDYDGTLIKGYTIAEAQALTTLPTVPTHDELTFQEWNYTLAQVNATTSPLDVGATYITTDGKTHFRITLTAASGLDLPLYFSKSDESELTIDWGDGNSETDTSSGNLTKTHTYAAVGNYVIKMWISSGNGIYGLGNGTTTTQVIGGGAAVYRQTLTECFIGDNIINLPDYVFYSSNSLYLITIPNSITSIGTSAFSGCSVLLSATIPRGITSLAQNLFSSCRSISSVIIPNGITTVGTSVFSGCYSLSGIILSTGLTAIEGNMFYTDHLIRSITIPSGVTSIGINAFSNCLNCKTFTIQATTPPTLANTNAFAGITSVQKIRVPSASLSAYQAAANWSTYANYMEGY